MLNGCDDLKEGIQKLINEVFLQFERNSKNKKVEEKDLDVISIPFTLAQITAPTRPTPLAITFSGPVPYSSEKAIPWK